MKYLKKYKLFESHDFPTDESEIDMICRELNLRNYTINQDGTVDVNGNVVLVNRRMETLPIRFGKVSGSFHLYDNSLTSLEGCPIEVGDFACEHNPITNLIGAPRIVTESFNCKSNELTSLEGAPEKVGSGFYCKKNKLVTLKGAPKEVGGDFWCSNNLLTSLEGAPDIVHGSFDCSDNSLESLENSPKEVGDLFSCEDNKLVSLKGGPKKVGGNYACFRNLLESLEGAPTEFTGAFYCYENNLTTLKGLPRKVLGLNCSDNNLQSLEGLRSDSFEKFLRFWDNPVSKFIFIFGDEDGDESAKKFIKSLDYNYFMGGNKIHESRFVRACDDLGIRPPDEIEGYEWV